MLIGKTRQELKVQKKKKKHSHTAYTVYTAGVSGVIHTHVYKHPVLIRAFIFLMYVGNGWFVGSPTLPLMMPLTSASF